MLSSRWFDNININSKLMLHLIERNIYIYYANNILLIILLSINVLVVLHFKRDANKLNIF